MSESISEALAAVWRDVLGRKKVGLDDSFFDLGGDSIKGARVVAAARARGVRITSQQLFDHETIANLARVAEVVDPAANSGLDLRRTGASSARATIHQELFWYIVRDSAESNQWIAPRHVISGPLDRAALDRSLTALIRAHSVFRTAYREADGTLQLVVLPLEQAPSFELAYFERAPVAAAAMNDELDSIARELAERGFDQARGLVVRAGLARFAADLHALVVVFDHMAIDAGGLAAFVDALFGAYRDDCAGVAARVEPALAFVDHAEALVRWNETPAGRAASAYWRERLRDTVPTDVACDLSRADVDRHRDEMPYGITASSMYPHRREDVAAPKLAQLMRETSATAPILYIAAVVWMLHRETKQTDICVEVVTSLRGMDARLRDLQGMLSTWLIYRVDVAGCASFRDVVRRVKQTAAEAQDHPIIDGYYRLVPHAVRRVVFNYVARTSASQHLQVAGVDVDTRIEVTEHVKRPWDLHVNVLDRGATAQVIWSGNQQLYTEQRLFALLARYTEILRRELG